MKQRIGLSLVSVLVAAAVGVSFIGSTCDLAADDCDEGQSECVDADALRVCTRPVPEAHRSWRPTSCGPTRTCMVDTANRAFCAELPVVACPTDISSCDDAGVLSDCRDVTDAGRVVERRQCGSVDACNATRTHVGFCEY